MNKKDIPYVWTDKKRTFLGLPLSFTRYFLTENKIITRKGFFNIEEDEMEIYKIDDKKMTFSFGQRIFGCGTIIIYSRDRDTPTKEIKSIKNARKVSDMIDQYLNDVRDKYGIRGRDLINIDGHENNDDNY
ncbi:MAG: PH domain-containing protein [Ruminococcus flavefaciens]|nr:PH domain-containing protein [Ruminococcus flavefaciens]